MGLLDIAAGPNRFAVHLRRSPEELLDPVVLPGRAIHQAVLSECPNPGDLELSVVSLALSLFWFVFY